MAAMAAWTASPVLAVPPPSLARRGRRKRAAFSVRAEGRSGEQDPFGPGKLTPKATDRLKSAVPPSAFNQPATGAGNKVLDAFRRTEKEGPTTKFGQPIVPTNIFEEPKQTKEEIEANKWKFTVSKQALFLVLSFASITLVMLGTVLVVWKLGGIHYDEY